jgi:hypothetical protein
MYQHPAFRPDQFALCYRAYASALLDIQSQKDRIDAGPPSDNTCLAVALRIIEASANGVRDIPHLKRFALANYLVGR